MWFFMFSCTVNKSPETGDTGEAPPTIEEVMIPAGVFQMGCTVDDEECADNESPTHTVEITRNYWMLTTEVTQELYEWVTGENPSEFTLAGDYPVEEVSWYDAVDFANELSQMEGLSPAMK